MIKIAHISDTHNDNSYLIPDCDLFIHSGDLTIISDEKYTGKFKK